LPDGPAFKPLLFLGADTAVGSAGGPGQTQVQLVWRGPNGALRQLRQLPAARYPSFRNVTASSRTLAWLEDTDNGAHLALWTIDLDDGRPARHVADVTGDAVFTDDAPYDLTLHEGTLTWVAADPARQDVTDVRSAALTGGPVVSQPEAGDWHLAAWPWLVNGTNDPRGATLLRNLVTHQDVAVPRATQGQTQCSPSWCEVVFVSGDGSTDVELVHPDGSARQRISSGTAVPAIPDVAPLSRFEVLWHTDPTLELTHNGELLIFDLQTRRTVQLSRNAASVGCRDGVVWWSNGDANQAAVSWHALDLHTV
jgi:hypothetical protein